MNIDPRLVTLVCPDNDAESRLILLMAYRLGMPVIRSGQDLGATLEMERGDLVPLIHAAGNDDVWIVEIPGPNQELRLCGGGKRLTIIDHHDYGDLELDRSRDENGNLLPSSLDQFLVLTGIDDEWMRSHGFDPIVVRGIAIMDARFVQGLREEGFTHEQICRVLDFRGTCARAGNPDFDRSAQAALKGWYKRWSIDGYTVVEADPMDPPLRGAVVTLTIYEGCDTAPIIVVEENTRELFVHNIDPELIERLKNAFPKGFTFGSGRCWGVSNAKAQTAYTLEHILSALCS